MQGSTRVICIAVLVLLLGPAALAGEVVVPFIGGDATITTDANGMASLDVPDFTSCTSPGDPSLPYAFKYVLLPPDADTATLRIQIRKGVETRVPGTFAVKPMGPAVSADSEKREYWGHNKPIWNGYNLSIYGEDKFYPADYATTDPVSQLGPYKMVPVRFWPYKFNPATGELRHLVRGEVAVIYDSIPGVSNASLPPTQPAFDQVVRNNTLNPDDASAMYDGVPSVASASTSILVITTQYGINVSTQLAPWISHKQAQGWTVDLVTNDIWGGGYGPAASIAMRNYLHSVYTNYRYAFIIGNPSPAGGDFPMAYTYPFGSAGEAHPSDLWYADHTGNWDLDSDGYLAEPEDMGVGGVDYNAELLVGRLPCYGNVTDLDHILAKMIEYDTTPTVSAKMQRVIYDAKPLDESTPGWQLGEAIRMDICNASRGREYFRIYDDTYGLMPPPEQYPTLSMPLIDQMNLGAGFLFWVTHGNIDVAVYVLDVASCIPLINDVSMTPFTFQGSCLNSYPEVDWNLSLALLKRGAICAIGATRNSWYYAGETTFTNSDSIQGMEYRYAYNLVMNKQACGDALYNMLLVVPSNMYQNKLIWPIYGDPSMAARWPTAFEMVSTSPLPDAKRGAYYRKDLFAAGGTMPYTWTLTGGSLPRGLTLDPTGFISGTPSRTGTFSFTLRCTEAGGAYVSRTFSISLTK